MAQFPQQIHTVDTVNAAMRKMGLAKALSTLHRYSNMDGGELYIALGDERGFYAVESKRPHSRCRVWVMAGRQPITCHGEESPDAWSSACTMLLGLKIAKAFGGSEPALGEVMKPWLDDLSVVMLSASTDRQSAPGSIPLAETLYNRALQHGVDMTLFRVYECREEHF